MDKNLTVCYGTLYVVATPIGNLQDISQRAVTVLQTVDAILAEDTRHSNQLLFTLDIQKKLISLHAHNENEKTDLLIENIKSGKSYALISDAGTPLIRDPGFALVRAAQQSYIKVVPIPGPCALIAALSASGVPCDQFTFVGFLPAKETARLKQLETLIDYKHTVVIYESTHRLTQCITNIASIYGDDYSFVLAKELTKKHENFFHGTASQINNWLQIEPSRIKGEFVLMLPPLIQPKNHSQDKTLLTVLLRELSLTQAVKIAKALSSTAKNELYNLALSIQKNI